MLRGLRRSWGGTHHTFVCVPCRHANRTGVDCPMCGEPTRRLYGRTPKRRDTRAWQHLARIYWRWDNTLPLHVRRAIELAALWRHR
jgi:hypothetical protein